MGIDAVALLRIADLAAPATAFGAKHLVQHRGDASLLHTMVRFDSLAPDEHALIVRKLLGAELDRHQDERGILFFCDVAEPRGRSYESIVSEVEEDGHWAPIVAADHVPLRFASPAEGSHDALVGELIRVMGYDAAVQFDMLAQVQAVLERSGHEDAEMAESYRSELDTLEKSLGKAFVSRYEASLRSKAALAG